MNPLVIFPLMLAATLQGAPAADTIHSKTTGENRFEITYTASGTTDPSEAQRRLMPEASRLCAPGQVTLGKYRFTGSEPLTPASTQPVQSVTLVQQIQCGADGTGNRGATTPPPTGPTTPSPSQDTGQDARIVALTEHYLDARAQGQFDVTHALMDETYLATIDEDAWRNGQTAFNQVAGESQGRVVYRVTWYDDPPGALPGRYAAADFVTLDAGLVFHCGYIAWRRHADDSFRVVREEDNSLDAASAARMSEQDQRGAKTRIGCPDVAKKPK